MLAALVAEAVFAVMPTREKEFCVDDVRCVAFLLWSVGMRANSLGFCVCRVIKIVGGSLSGSKVVRGMVFGRESEGAFFHPPPSFVYINLDQPP
jgi:hypothetical protein